MTRVEAAQRIYNDMVGTYEQLGAETVVNVVSGGPLEVTLRFESGRSRTMTGLFAHKIQAIMREVDRGQ